MRWFKNMKIRPKLILGFMISVALTAAVGVVGVYGILSMDKISEAMYKEKALPLGDLAGATEYFQRLRVQARNAIIFAGDPEQLSQVESDMNVRFEQMEAAMQAYRPTLASPEAEALYGETGSNYYDEFKPGVIEILEGAKRGEDTETLVALMRMTTVSANIIAENLVGLTQMRMDVMSDANDEGSAMGTMLLTVIIVVIVLAALISIIVALYISGMISNNLKMITAFMQRAGSTGDITLNAAEQADAQKEKFKDETGVLLTGAIAFIKHVTNVSQELNAIADGDLTTQLEILSEKDVMGLALQHTSNNLNSMFNDISTAAALVAEKADLVEEGARQIASTTHNIAEGAQTLAKGSTDQAASVQELSGSMTVIEEKTATNAQIAEKTAKLADSVIANAEKGNRQMEDMINAVKDIAEANQSIQSIMNTIDSIASQTNLLSLNAAIEAARAGEHGRGFAVVADEVRILAAQSAEAAQKTSEIIKISIDKSQLGTQIVDETAASFKEIVTGLNESSEMIKSIASASEEQATNISHVKGGIDQVSDIVEQNSATAEESAAASEESAAAATDSITAAEELKLQAETLKRLVMKFKLR